MTRTALIGLVALLGSAGFSPAWALHADEASSGTLLMLYDEATEPSAALRLSSEIRASVVGNLVRVTLVQRFRNDDDRWAEGLYVYPLAATAAVDTLRMRIGQREIRGEIRSKDVARAEYRQAKAQGQTTVLAEQDRPNMFTTQVANIEPHGQVQIEIGYLDTVAPRDGEYRLHIPLAITPRYAPVGQDNRAPDSPSRELVEGSAQELTIGIDFAPGFAPADLRSLNHPLTSDMHDGIGELRVAGRNLPMDRDFELVWRAAQDDAISAAAFSEQFGGERFTLLTLTPPVDPSARVPARDVVFIVDTSGSMGGPSIDQARAALQMAIRRLRPEDRFNIIRFADDAEALYMTLQPANSLHVGEAQRFIAALTADGGTEMRDALAMALAMSGQNPLQQIVFITDGSVSNEQDLLGMVENRLGKRRLFTVGIGAAPNSWFMREAAIAGHGSFVFIADSAQIAERMSSLFEKLEHPALRELALQFPDGGDYELAAPLPGDLYAGDPLMIVLRHHGIIDRPLLLSGSDANGYFSTQFAVRELAHPSGIGKLWARERIASLERSRLRADLSLDARAAIDRDITVAALRHGLVTRLTSLVAVDKTPARRPGEALAQRQLPTVAPRGSFWAREAGMPSTATGSPLMIAVGMLLLLLAAARYYVVSVRALPAVSSP
ncbi:MAG: marine proteobacterial sortase target protein [Steroidobacteraceae bacterium]